jgi:hypothetical protein
MNEFDEKAENAKLIVSGLTALELLALKIEIPIDVLKSITTAKNNVWEYEQKMRRCAINADI